MEPISFLIVSLIIAGIVLYDTRLKYKINNTTPPSTISSNTIQQGEEPVLDNDISEINIDLASPFEIFFFKLQNRPLSLTQNDVVNFLLKVLDNDTKLLSSLFALEKTYFETIILLTFNGLLNSKDIRNLIGSDYYNRKEILLNLLSKDEGNIQLFGPLVKFLNSKFYNLPLNNVDTKINTLSTVNSSQKLNDSLLEYMDYILGRSLFGSTATETPQDYFQSLSRKLSSTNDDFTSIQSNLDGLSLSNNKVLDKKKFYTVLLNKNMQDILKRSYANRLSLGYPNLNSIYTGLEISSIVRNAIKESVNDTDNTYYNYFRSLFWVYNNTDNYTTNDNFNFATYNQQADTDGVNEYEFTYIIEDHLEFKNILNQIFPYNASYSVSRDSKYYIPKYFISFDSDFQNNDEKSIYNLNKGFVEPALTALFENNIVADEFKNIITLGNFSKMSYVFDILNAFASEKENYLSIEELRNKSYNDINEYIGLLKIELVNFVKTYNLGTPSEKIFKIFLVDIVSQYFDYLLNAGNFEFNATLTNDTMKLYRLLSFTQQTFISAVDLIDNAENDESFRLFSEIVSSYGSPDFAKAFLSEKL